ncbi:dolichyl-monophosphooligosaccharide--protein glycotransferase AglB [Natronomonas pharaonis DSM 2160]|uniref:dolichyl-phosphooligosaccharide-protein glycotransferase n=1 Tax=Natronomonas pharaonis (strain ATCC 35678 / DSM 2160 / CIP 103997 / JCM 8858 / NBRC 14720 / NCIMB 2260 / Gabara) TaxID=348780 RepID=Q3IPK0_NATPD|nr:oligosaccharyl transferase, archaeosortase A system-associated [Natronomonas pharaonis]CAI49951.1 dolichyl-monophosphooligosaccharide--protein glycotransferase AglB [Natronomonas pharaonis DSM 2160]
MSQRLDEFEERLEAYESQIDTVYRLYHIPVLAVLMAFMLWVRIRDYGRHIAADGTVLYRGNDPYYHYRTTNYVLENYPFNMPFDPWTSFDTGTRVGQFGTILDQLVATAALIVGLGSPSEETVILTTLFSGPVLAALCAIPLYFIGKRLGGRFGGIIAVVVLALTAGQFLTRSVAGYYGHHVTEVLFTLIALLVGMKMVAVAQREKPIYEFVRTREFDLLREPVLWGAAFGVTLVVAILNWPPAVFLFGVFAAFLFVQLSLEFIRGHSPDHIAIPSVVAMVATAVLLLPFIQTTELTVTDYSVFHLAFALGVAAGAVVMAGVARLWERRDIARAAYPAGVVGVGLIGVAVIAVALPSVFDFLISQVERVAGFGATDTRATIGEAQAPDSPVSFFFANYGLGIYTALAGFGLLLYRVFSTKRPQAEYLLIAVFSAFMLAFTLTQVRFDYYFVIAVGAGNAYLVGWVYQYVDLDNVRQDFTNIQPYQILIVIAILFVIAGVPLVTGATLATADDASQPGEMEQWTDSLDWLSEETPEPGAYGTGDDPRLDYYGTYEPTDDFEYEAGEYGVLSWWDYGHYITTRGERIPVANPFQHHATESADFLLADDEDEALDLLDENHGDGEGVQYVMVDYQLGYAGTQKYGAPTAFESEHDISDGDVGIQVINPETGEFVYGAHTQRGYDSMRVQLYQHHGSAQEPASFTLQLGEYDEASGIATIPEGAQPDDLIQEHASPEEAREAAQAPNVIHGGVLGQPGERTEALEHFRLVHAGGPVQPSMFELLMTQQVGAGDQWVKTFERVDGATIEGTGPAESEIQAAVEIDDGTGEAFTYTQFAETDADGNFEMTVPYATTGYDEYGVEEGYTNTDVRANTTYQFIEMEEGMIAEADVSEAQVIGEDDSPVAVEMEPFEESDLTDPAPDGDVTAPPEEDAADEEMVAGSVDGDETADGETGDDETAEE